MILSELLEATAEDFLDDRTELLAGDADDLFSDKVITRYLNEAQRRLCRRAWVLVDIAHPVAGVITLVSGKTVYPLHKSVLRVLDARLATSEIVPLPRVADKDITGYLPPSTDFFDINDITARTPGNPLAFATDTGTRLLRVTPAPAADQAGVRVYLRVARMPVCELRFDKPDDKPEVDEHWHLDGLCQYAAGKCLMRPNADATTKVIGKELIANFERLVREARQERERAWASEPRPEFCSTTAWL